MSDEDFVALCQGATSTMPAQCLNALPYNFKATPLGIQLCAGASSTEPAKCIGAVTAARFSEEDKVEGCRGATSAGPAQCITAVPFQTKPNMAVALCRGAASEAPAKCLAALHLARHVGDGTKVDLCRGVRTRQDAAAVATCANAAPVTTAAAVLGTLCAAAPHDSAASSGSHTARQPLLCYNAVYRDGITDAGRASLCQGVCVSVRTTYTRHTCN